MALWLQSFFFRSACQATSYLPAAHWGHLQVVKMARHHCSFRRIAVADRCLDCPRVRSGDRTQLGAAAHEQPRWTLRSSGPVPRGGVRPRVGRCRLAGALFDRRAVAPRAVSGFSLGRWDRRYRSNRRRATVLFFAVSPGPARPRASTICPCRTACVPASPMQLFRALTTPSAGSAEYTG